MVLQQKLFIAAVVVAAGLTYAAAGFAQTAARAQPQAAPAAGLNLTQAQRDQIKALRDAQRKDAQVLGEKLRAARQQLREATRADVPDEAAVRAAAEALAALDVDRAVLRARSRARFMTVLTPEQRARVQERTARAAQRAMRAERQRMMRGDRLMRQQVYRWWRGWI